MDRESQEPLCGGRTRRSGSSSRRERWLTNSGIVGASYIPSRRTFLRRNAGAEKLRRIAGLRLTHFVDDLSGVLDDPAFPRAVTRPVHFRESWDAVANDIFA